MATLKKQSVIELPAMDVQNMEITLIGDSSLICHKWSEKAKKQMLAKQMKEAQPKKEAKNPEQDFRDSLYEHPDGGYGFPVVAFKAAAVSACRFVEGLKMTEARGAFHINGELALIEGSEPIMREDMVKIAMGTADLRYRGEFPQWHTTLTIRYNAQTFSPSQILNLFNHAGFGVGVGEWRPERDGSHGMFHVRMNDELLPGG